MLFVLSVLRRAAFGDEIAAAAQLSKGETGLSLKKLSDGELITEGREGRTRSYQIKAASVAEPFLRGTSPRRVRAVHARLADHLKRARPRDPKRLAYLARHLLRNEGRMKLDFAGAQPPAEVAAAVVRALERNRAETPVGWQAKWLSRANRWAPWFVDRMMARKVRQLYS